MNHNNASVKDLHTVFLGFDTNHNCIKPRSKYPSSFALHYERLQLQLVEVAAATPLQAEGLGAPEGQEETTKW